MSSVDVLHSTDDASFGGIGDAGELNAVNVDDDGDFVSGKNGMADIAGVGEYKNPFEKRVQGCHELQLRKTETRLRGLARNSPLR